VSPNALFSVFQAGTDLVGLDYEDKDEQNGEGCISPHGEFAIYPPLFSSASQTNAIFLFFSSDWVKLETQDPFVPLPFPSPRDPWSLTSSSSPSRRKDGICLCCVDWATLEKRELDLMRNGQRGDEEADWIAFRRRGGGTPDEERSRSRERKATELYAVVGEDAERKALQARSPSRGTPVRR
jgi:hypothetical protein